MTDQLRYPVGRYTPPAAHTAESRRQAIATLRALPAQLRALVEPLTDADLARPYRPGGWSVRQVVHHLPDSHLNAYVRL